MANFFSAWLRNRQAFHALSRLTDRELADVGIGRDEIGNVVERASGRPARDGELAPSMAPSWGRHNRRSLAN